MVSVSQDTSTGVPVCAQRTSMRLIRCAKLLTQAYSLSFWLPA